MFWQLFKTFVVSELFPNGLLVIVLFILYAMWSQGQALCKVIHKKDTYVYEFVYLPLTILG